MVRTGEQYLAGLRDSRNVVYDGRLIEDVTTEPGFRRTAKTVAQFYDFQNDPNLQDLMTYETEDGDRAGMAFIEPRSIEDLRRRGDAMAAWAEVTCGLMGRSPDYMNSVMMAIGAKEEAWGYLDKQIGVNARQSYLEARRNDSCITHTIVPMFGDKSVPAEERDTTLREVDVGSEGPILTGAKGVGTLAVFSDLNVLFGAFGLPEDGDPAQAISAVHPVAADGLFWVCRDTFDDEKSEFDAPLSSRGLDEMDTVAIYENAEFKKSNFFVYRDVANANALMMHMKFFDTIGQHILVRYIAKTRFMLGLAHLLAESSQVNQFFNVQERLGEFATWLEALEALYTAAIEGAFRDPDNGLFYPNRKAVMSAIRLFAEWNRQMISHFISIGASGLVSVPQEKTLDMFSENIGKYFSGAGGQYSKERVSLFRMAWDLAGSSWGGRNELYERFFTGDSQRAIANTYLRMDKSEAVDIIRRMLLPGENGHPFPLPEKFGGPALPPLVEDTEECLD